jgi:hypothetical protein
MIRLVAKKLNPHYVSIERKQVEKLVLIYSLGTETFFLHEYQESIKNYIQKEERHQNKLTSGFKLETRIVHLSFVPLIPGGKPPPKAAAIAAALGI